MYIYVCVYTYRFTPAYTHIFICVHTCLCIFTCHVYMIIYVLTSILASSIIRTGELRLRSCFSTAVVLRVICPVRLYIVDVIRSASELSTDPAADLEPCNPKNERNAQRLAQTSIAAQPHGRHESQNQVKSRYGSYSLPAACGMG